MKLPSQKTIDIILALVFILLIVFLINYVGSKVAAVFSGILMFLGLRKSPQDKIDDAKENIQQAGDDIEKPTPNTPESALNKYDDFFDNNPS